MSEATKAQLAEEVQVLRRQVAALQQQLATRSDHPPQPAVHDQACFQALPMLTSEYLYGLRVDGGTVVPEWDTEALSRLTGYAKAELATKGWLAVVHPDDRAAANEHIRQALAGRTDTREFRIVTRSGETRWLSARASPQWDPGGQRIIGVLGAARDVTELKRAVDELRESRELLRQITTTMQEVFWLCAHDPPRILYISPGYEALWGLSTESLYSDPWSFLGAVHPDDRPRMANVFAEMARGPQEWEYRVVRPDGSVRWLRSRSFPVRNEAGRADRSAGITEDITERKLAEQALIERDALLRAVMTNVPVVLFALDRDGVFTLSEGKGLAGLGLRPGEAVGRSVFAMFPDIPDLAYIRRVLAGEDLTWETALGPAHYETRLSPVRDAKGEVIGAIGVAFDITARKQAEAALRASEEKWRSLVENAPDFILMLDRDGTILFLNRATEGLSREQVIGTSAYDYVEPEYRPVMRQALDRVFTTGTAVWYEVRGTGPHGSVAWYASRLGPVTRDGQVVAAILIGTDITERKRVEEELRQARAELERRVEERTRDLRLANQHLQREIIRRELAEAEARQRLAELAHVARLSTVGEMATGLAHELIQPLSAIGTYAQAGLQLLAEWGRGPADLTEALAQIAAQTERAGAIIKRIRRLVTRREPHRSTVDVNEAVRNVLALLARDLQVGRVTTRLQLADRLPPVLGDRIQLEQVVLNLIRNAEEALGGQPGELIVRTALTDAGTIEVAISDTGCGLTPEVQARLFQPFFTTKPQGMGMGLAISRSIIEAHGGRLFAAPHAPRGSTFCFTLPISREAGR
jgi:PAS domain S-box-containing protein